MAKALMSILVFKSQCRMPTFQSRCFPLVSAGAFNIEHAMRIVIMFVLLVGVANANILKNPDFEHGLAAWKKDKQATSVGIENVEGKRSAVISVASWEDTGFPKIYQEIDVSVGDILRGEVDILVRDVRDGVGGYLVFEYMGSDGERTSFTESSRAMNVGGWSTYSVRSVVPPSCNSVRVSLIFNGRGKACFSGARLICQGRIESPPLIDPVILTATKEVVCKNFLGFGVEDDGWFYNSINAAKGVDAEDIALRESRIERMDPDTVRLFIWHLDYCPSGDWERFDFETNNMQSKYRTLDLYQRIGARANITCVDWGMRRPYDDPSKVAHAIGQMLDHLVRVKGYTCIRDFTFTNEPDTACQRQFSWQNYITIHRLLRDEFKKRQLAISIIGSDECTGLAWFQRCLEDGFYAGLVGSFSSHCFYSESDSEICNFFFRERLDLINKHAPGKPLLLMEFSLQDSRSDIHNNPIMDEWKFAQLTARFVIEGLNQGVSGFSMWSIHEMYYSQEMLMTRALWKFKDSTDPNKLTLAQRWKPRPVFYLWNDLCSLTEPGVKVRKCTSSQPAHITAVRVGDVLFWANRAAKTARIRIEGFDADSVHIVTEKSLRSDMDYGTIQSLKEGTFNAPAKSFGYLQMTP